MSDSLNTSFDFRKPTFILVTGSQEGICREITNIICKNVAHDSTLMLLGHNTEAPSARIEKIKKKFKTIDKVTYASFNESLEGPDKEIRESLAKDKEQVLLIHCNYPMDKISREETSARTVTYFRFSHMLHTKITELVLRSTTGAKVFVVKVVAKYHPGEAWYDRYLVAFWKDMKILIDTKRKRYSYYDSATVLSFPVLVEERFVLDEFCLALSESKSTIEENFLQFLIRF